MRNRTEDQIEIHLTLIRHGALLGGEACGGSWAPEDLTRGLFYRGVE